VKNGGTSQQGRLVTRANPIEAQLGDQTCHCGDHARQVIAMPDAAGLETSK